MTIDLPSRCPLCQNKERRLKATLRQSNIRKNVTCHTLRHSYATHLVEAGVHLRVIQALLGHKSITTTFIYMHLTQSTMVNVQKKIKELMILCGLTSYANVDPVLQGHKSGSPMTNTLEEATS